MDTNINAHNVEKLSDDEIKEYFEWLRYAEPYTDEEILELPFDDAMDLYRMRAYTAKEVLKKNGLL